MSKTETLHRGVYLHETDAGWFHIRFRDPDRAPEAKSVALDTNDRGKAYADAYEKLGRYLAGAYDPWEDPERDLPAALVLKRYRDARRGEIRKDTVYNTAQVCDLFLRSLRRPKNMREIDAEDVRAFVYKPGREQYTKLSYYTKLNVWFNWAAANGYLKTSPADSVKRPKKPKPQPKYLEPDELELLLRYIEVHNATNAHDYREDVPYKNWTRDAIELAAWVGLRKSEIERLNWGDIQLPNEFREIGFLVPRSVGDARTKNDEEEPVPLVPRALEVLRRLQARRRTEDPDEPVCKAADGVSRISGDYLSRRFRFFRKEAKLRDGVGLHGMRHTFAALCRYAGIELYDLQRLMRHNDIQTTLKYGSIGPHRRATDTYEAFQRLEGKLR